MNTAISSAISSVVNPTTGDEEKWVELLGRDILAGAVGLAPGYVLDRVARDGWVRVRRALVVRICPGDVCPGRPRRDDHRGWGGDRRVRHGFHGRCDRAPRAHPGDHARGFQAGVRRLL